jgi:hypothetical protein
VLAERQQMIDLERRRNMNREALASLRRIERQGGDVAAQSKHWICLGDVFVKRPHGPTRAMLEEDGRRLEAEVEGLRTSVKKKTSELCELDSSMCDRPGFSKLGDSGMWVGTGWAAAVKPGHGSLRTAGQKGCSPANAASLDSRKPPRGM